MTVTLFRGDCIEIAPTLPAQSVHAIITDLPYGTTACKWDTIIPFADLWRVVKHVLMPRGAFVTTASQPFTSALIMSNVEWFKYCWIWEKTKIGNVFNCKNAPQKNYEDIIVFSDGTIANKSANLMRYYPQGLIEVNITRNNADGRAVGTIGDRPSRKGLYQQKHMNYPRQIIKFANPIETTHPTQKPVALYEYLIRTYTNAGDTVLDLTMGSGTTGVACVNTGRNFIGIELDAGYFAIAEQRIAEAQAQMRLPL